MRKAIIPRERITSCGAVYTSQVYSFVSSTGTCHTLGNFTVPRNVCNGRILKAGGASEGASKTCDDKKVVDGVLGAVFGFEYVPPRTRRR